MTVFIEISFDNIYSFATGRIKCYSNKPFSIEFSRTATLVGLESGLIDNGVIKSATDKGMEIIKASIIGLISEKPILCADQNGTVESYGMQYFPFISSTVNLNFNVKNNCVQAITLTFPDTYRVIWFRQHIKINDNMMSMTHSQGEKESTYVFLRTFDKTSEPHSTDEDIDECVNGEIPIRLGGKEYLRIVTFPLLYFGVSLLAVSLLAMQDKPNVTFGAMAAFWGLMLRNFGVANAPQLNTVLRDMYFILGGGLLIWTTIWEVFELKALVAILPVAWLYYLLRVVNITFSQEGVLPAFIEKVIYRIRKRNEIRNFNKTKS
jgi:hypothetical protein